MKTALEIRLQNVVDEREVVGRQHEELVRAMDLMEEPSQKVRDQIQGLRERSSILDTEIAQLGDDITAESSAKDAAQRARRLVARESGVEMAEGDSGYGSFYAYARDVILTRSGLETVGKIAAQVGRSEVEAARERLEILARADDPTAIGVFSTGNLAGLNPYQHIAQIFQVINKSRPLVDSAKRTTLERGNLSYPFVSARPTVVVNNTEFNEPSATSTGNTKMTVQLETAAADVYTGIGQLSWQAINWSTPDALQLWLDLCAADYALKTETAAGTAVQTSGKTYDIASALGATYTFSQFLTAVGAGAAAVYDNSLRSADTIYMSEDAYWYVFGLTSDQFAQFASVTGAGIGPMAIVRTRGLPSGSIVVGDSSALLVAETAGAPVELQVTQPSVNALEVGLIGAFKSVVVDPGAFSHITSAS